MSDEHRTVCDGCGTEITPWVALKNCSLGPLNHTRLDLCDKCRDHLTAVLGVKPRIDAEAQP